MTTDGPPRRGSQRSVAELLAAYGGESRAPSGPEPAPEPYGSADAPGPPAGYDDGYGGPDPYGAPDRGRDAYGGPYGGPSTSSSSYRGGPFGGHGSDGYGSESFAAEPYAPDAYRSYGSPSYDPVPYGGGYTDLDRGSYSAPDPYGADPYGRDTHTDPYGYQGVRNGYGAPPPAVPRPAGPPPGSGPQPASAAPPTPAWSPTTSTSVTPAAAPPATQATTAQPVPPAPSSPTQATPTQATSTQATSTQATPTQATSSAASRRVDAPAGLGSDDEYGDEYGDDDEYDEYADYDDEPAERPTAVEWAVIAGQLVVGALLGALLWIGFSYLWQSLPVVALVLAAVATGGLVFGVRAMRRSDDLQTMVLAIVVGLVVTVSPAAFVLLAR